MSLCFKLPMEDSIKLAWRKVTLGASIPFGKLACIDFIASSIVSVRRMVSAPGCF